MSANQDKQCDEEKALFEVFLNCHPDFAGDAIADWKLTERQASIRLMSFAFRRIGSVWALKSVNGQTKQ